MNICVIGTGYVGLVTGACLAEVGNKVMCVDVDPAKIDLLNNGGVPIYEPGLTEMLRSNHAAGRLNFTLDAAEGVAHGLFQFIAVGTPPDEDGSADLQHVLAVAGSIGEHLSERVLLVPLGGRVADEAAVVRALPAQQAAARAGGAAGRPHLGVVRGRRAHTRRADPRGLAAPRPRARGAARGGAADRQLPVRAWPRHPAGGERRHRPRGAAACLGGL